ncbi:hypothetical protein V1264_018649 [Littorina saxatilis]|uniref:Sulphur transport domain-containing protein n=1 Tax=Littorina saxatilis TaxID=31220 RepID=A0AAN9BES2_9CAEN
MLDPLRRRQQETGFQPYDDRLDTEHGKQKQTFGWQSLRLFTSALGGVVFGFAVEKSRVFEPSVIRDQMLFGRFVMMKVFLAASATSMFSFSILTMLPATSQLIASIRQARVCSLGSKGVLSSILGGAMLGTGMTLSGACPGMVLAQAGAGVSGAIYTLLGGFLGVACYGMMEPAIVRATKPDIPVEKHYLHQHVGGPYFTLAFPLVAVLGMVVFGLELYAPWTSEVPVAGKGILTSLSWPPYFAGIVIGLLQIPTVIMNCDTLGSSSSYCTIASQALQKVSPYLSRYSSGVDNWWQVFYVGGAVMGAYLSASSSGYLGHTAGVAPVLGCIGGALMLFGSRLAAGCTSGHGLSGMGLLSLLSLTAVPAMFAGGIATALVMNYYSDVDYAT